MCLLAIFSNDSHLVGRGQIQNTILEACYTGMIITKFNQIWPSSFGNDLKLHKLFTRNTWRTGIDCNSSSDLSAQVSWKRDLFLFVHISESKFSYLWIYWKLYMLLLVIKSSIWHKIGFKLIPTCNHKIKRCYKNKENLDVFNNF